MRHRTARSVTRSTRLRIPGRHTGIEAPVTNEPPEPLAHLRPTSGNARAQPELATRQRIGAPGAATLPSPRPRAHAAANPSPHCGNAAERPPVGRGGRAATEHHPGRRGWSGRHRARHRTGSGTAPLVRQGCRPPGPEDVRQRIRCSAAATLPGGPQPTGEAGRHRARHRAGSGTAPPVVARRPGRESGQSCSACSREATASATSRIGAGRPSR